MLKTTRHGEVTRFDSARTLLGRGWYWTTAYHVDGLLVDSGCPHAAGELGEALQGCELNCIVNTHSHEDHIGANGILLGQHRGLEARAHPAALPIMATAPAALPLQPYRRLLWGFPEPSTAKAVSDGEWIETARYRFQVLYTPGHSPDHLCLYEPSKGWLFTGDLFVGGRERALRLDYDIWEIIASLKRVGSLPVQVLFPGCARVREEAGRELAEKVTRLEELGAQVMALHQRGMGSGAITRALCGHAMAIEFITLGHFSRRNLVRSFLARTPGGENRPPPD